MALGQYAATGAIIDTTIWPAKGKETGEQLQMLRILSRSLQSDLDSHKRACY